VNARLPARLAGRRRWWLLSATILIAAAAVVVITIASGLGTASSTNDSALPPAPDCPSALLVASTLNQTIEKATAAVLHFGGGPSRGSRLTCSYTTAHGTTIDYELTSNVNPYAIVTAEEAGFGAHFTLSGGPGAGFEHAKTKAVVIPAFAPGLIAWTLKQGGLLDALYGTTNLFIIAPNATPSEMEALAKDTQGIPQPNLKVSKSA
jgi:hypothetical protein